MSRRRVLDLLLVATVLALALAAAVDAIRTHRHAPATPRRAAQTTAAPAPARAPPLIALRGSPETAFLPDCRRTGVGVSLSIEPRGPLLVLRRTGGRCHLPTLRFAATVRDSRGHLLYRGPALDRHGFPGGSFAGPVKLTADLLPGLLHCDVQGPVGVVVHGAGLSASGTIRCRGSL
ncbi:MAG TPA: hypothetical protein VF101_10385 [Gaiellaceae bacterium]